MARKDWGVGGYRRGGSGLEFKVNGVSRRDEGGVLRMKEGWLWTAVMDGEQMGGTRVVVVADGQVGGR